ncbi:MAG: choice-of-anchor D domain-containing protein [Granulosicoccus sp.]
MFFRNVVLSIAFGVSLVYQSALANEVSGEVDVDEIDREVEVAEEVEEVETSTGPQQIVVPLTGTAAVVRSGQLVFSANTIDMGTVEIGQTQTLSWNISHDGDSDAPPVVVRERELFGLDVADFSTDFRGLGERFTLVAGESIEASVSFTPSLPGDKTAGMRLHIEGDTAPYVLLFQGVARAPLSSDLDSSDFNVNFGQVAQNNLAEDSFVLSNEGEIGAPVINVTAMQLAGTNAQEFNIDFQPFALAPGDEKKVDLMLDTQTPGFKSASIEVQHDGANSNLQIELQGTVKVPAAAPVNFTMSTVNTAKDIVRGTSIQFGPDDKLYVAIMDGDIHVFDVNRQAKNKYSAVLLETIDLIRGVPNHNDDGTRDFANKRLLTGIHVTGTAGSPVIYAASSDPRQAAGPSGNDVNLDTNSGILHKLSKSGGNWKKQDLVRGLPRSEENHVANGLVLVGNKIYLNIGGNTNEGAPSNNFAELPEYALSAAVLEIDLGQIGNSTYDIPTLNGPADEFDPFGGHDGLNQAMLVENGPIELFATGLRNAYDIVYTESGRIYAWDNGGNTGCGGPPGPGCSDDVNDAGKRGKDGLHLLKKGYYAGHPNPTRGSKNNTFGGQSPIEGPANPVECEYRFPGPASGALTLNTPSTNGLDEYTAGNFGNAMKGDLLAVAFDKSLYRVEFNGNGTVVTSKSVLQSGIGQAPLDVTTQGNNGEFPGTIWIVDNIDKQLRVLEPADY